MIVTKKKLPPGGLTVPKKMGTESIVVRSNYFDLLHADYQNAEISSVILHNRTTNKWYNLFSVIELIPEEQETSPPVGDKSSHFCQRENIDSDYSVYIARRIICPVDEAIAIFKNPENGILIEHEPPTLNCSVEPFDSSHQEAEPASDHPIVITAGNDNTYSAVLPKRKTSFRVWSKIDRQKKWLAQFTKKQREKMFSKAGLLTQRLLGFDLSSLREHSGNIYLCCCNPYLRSMNSSLLDLDHELVIHFLERAGRSIKGLRLIIEDDRENNLSYSLEKIINNTHERISLPHFPSQLIMKLYDHNGHLIECNAGRWTNYSFGLQTQTGELNLTIKNNSKKKTLKIPKYVSEKPVTIGSYDHSLSQYLKEANQLRRLNDLEKSGDFIFFPGSNDDKEKARIAISELLNKSKKLCMLLDPYFGAGDLFYAYIIQNTSVPIQILSSAAFLKSRQPVSSHRKMKQAFLLNRALNKYKKAFPLQSIQVKVLAGSVSPLHDRYIIIDGHVYLLGSSFNEFGSRATTLIKVPYPQPMIDQALLWWKDTAVSKDLNDYVNALKK